MHPIGFMHAKLGVHAPGLGVHAFLHANLNPAEPD